MTLHDVTVDLLAWPDGTGFAVERLSAELDVQELTGWTLAFVIPDAPELDGVVEDGTGNVVCIDFLTAFGVACGPCTDGAGVCVAIDHTPPTSSQRSTEVEPLVDVAPADIQPECTPPD